MANYIAILEKEFFIGYHFVLNCNSRNGVTYYNRTLIAQGQGIENTEFEYYLFWPSGAIGTSYLLFGLNLKKGLKWMIKKKKDSTIFYCETINKKSYSNFISP
jgi:hypothetical protein